jgi:hypothetical protein
MTDGNCKNIDRSETREEEKRGRDSSLSAVLILE